MQFFVDDFATVAEAVAWVEDTNVQVVQMVGPTGGKLPAIHLALDDATGDSAIIEYSAGQPKVDHSAEYTVKTSSPTHGRDGEAVPRCNAGEGCCRYCCCRTARADSDLVAPAAPPGEFQRRRGRCA
ncbi:linear amide C-N hydrolase [Agromyces sp. NPDC055520]